MERALKINIELDVYDVNWLDAVQGPPEVRSSNYEAYSSHEGLVSRDIPGEPFLDSWLFYFLCVFTAVQAGICT